MDSVTFRSAEENQRVYDLIWSQMPHMQKPASSSWWFFLLFPRDDEGYGRRQLMFAVATRAGKRIRISDVWLPGLDLKRCVVDGEDRFHALAVGWYCDGQQVHEDFVKAAAPTTLSAREKVLRCWTPEREGMEIRAGRERPLSLETHVSGPSGSANFEAWGDLHSLHASPHESLNIETFAGGTHFIAWRRMNFRGEFDLPTGRETLEGLCYFQRVCLNVPTFPWKWIWSLFPDGAMFSAYVPYVGLNLLRKGYRFFGSNRREQTSISIAGAGFWDWPDASEQVLFNLAHVTPILGYGRYPQFGVQVSNPQGDHLTFQAVPFGHTDFYIDRPLFGGRCESHWHYNEYMFRTEHLNGAIGGKHIAHQTMGQGFGNLEYTWGLGL